ncbi:hypothetical protein PR048_030867 [Dryococelus australis]|uniref:Uncharacterized protein n=1 Tax=Dryococelus australis TaxID=614101 RepID=A0ABQ9GCX5_9NEOP|nr:hypothetical protein PR048_030867 [Dryococelus australis]
MDNVSSVERFEVKMEQRRNVRAGGNGSSRKPCRWMATSAVFPYAKIPGVAAGNRSWFPSVGGPYDSKTIFLTSYLTLGRGTTVLSLSALLSGVLSQSWFSERIGAVAVSISLRSAAPLKKSFFAQNAKALNKWQPRGVGKADVNIEKLRTPRNRLSFYLWRGGGGHRGAAVIALASHQGDPPFDSRWGRSSDFRLWEPWWTVSLAGRFSRGSPVFSALAFRHISLINSLSMSPKSLHWRLNYVAVCLKYAFINEIIKRASDVLIYEKHTHLRRRYTHRDESIPRQFRATRLAAMGHLMHAVVSTLSLRHLSASNAAKTSRMPEEKEEEENDEKEEEK